MLMKRVIRKLFIVTITMFIILTIYTIPVLKNEKVLRTNLEVEDIVNLNNDTIYLLNKNDLFVKVNFFNNGKNLETKIRNIINYLTLENNNIPKNLNGYIPENTKINSINIDSNLVEIDFSKEFTNYKVKEKTIITGLVFSLLELKEISAVSITVNGQKLSNYQTPITKSIGINNNYLFSNRRNINKVVVYYYDNDYYVPVTKYLDDKQEKIEVIINELKNSNEKYTSYLNDKVQLLDYYEENNAMFLNFNEYLKDNDLETTKKIINEIAYSVFDNYDVDMVFFKINDKQFDYVKKS